MRVGAAALTLAGLLGPLVALPAAAQWQQPQPGYGQPGYGQPPPAQQVPYGSPPPPMVPMGPPPGVRETERQLDQAKTEDSGRKLEWVWLDVHAGFQQLGLQTFKGDRTLTGGFVPTSGPGGVFAVGAGVRLLFLTVLARGRVGVSGVGQLYELGGEVGFHVPLGRVEPHVQLGAGYAAAAQLHDDANGAAAALFGLHGFYARAGGGVDVFLLPVLSVGVDVSAELVGVSRSAVADADVAKLKLWPASQQGNADLLRADASSLGGALSATGVLGLHF